MRSRKNRNAHRQSLNHNPNPYSTSLLHDFDTPNPVLSPQSLPVVDLSAEPTGETDLIDMHANAVRDLDTSSPLVSTSPRTVPNNIISEGINLGDQGSIGHIRSPVMARQPTMLETFSRAFRNYVPSSIPISTAAPAPPRISRPVPIGNFMPSSMPPTIFSTSPAPERPESSSEIGVTHSKTQSMTQIRTGLGGLSEVFGSDDEDENESAVSIERRTLSTTYPGVGEGDMILWSKWDELRVDFIHSRRLLFLGYSSGLQIWDCTNLGSVSEVLNMSDSDLGRIEFAGVLAASPSVGTDSFISQRPLIGIIPHTRDKLLVYSLRTHQTVKSLVISDLRSFSSNDRFIIICTTNPPSLQILSSISFETLHIIPSTSLAPFTQLSLPKFDTTIASVSEREPSCSDTLSRLSQAQPVFSSSHRLLAFASVSPSPSSATTVPAAIPRIQSRFSAGSFNMSQAELSHTALKVGGSVLSGMRSIGELAYSAAKIRVSPSEYMQNDMKSSDASGLSNLFFSKSAPASSNSSREHRAPVSSIIHEYHPQDVHPPSDPLLAHGPSSSKSFYVTILDMATLLNPRFSKPVVIAEFIASKQPISQLEFVGDGNSLAVSSKDGHVVRIFHIKPPPLVSRDVSNTSVSGAEGTCIVSRPWHVYDLRRGRTSAVVEGISVSDNGLWAAVATRKRTVHLFAINPYGGKPDQRSHLEGRVQNVTELQPLSTQVLPIVRLRTAKPASEQSFAPITFIFIKSSESSVPANLLPPVTVSTSLPTSVHSSPVRQPEGLSPRHVQRATNFQDVLLFDPIEGILSLRRLTVEIRTRDQGPSLPATVHSFRSTSTSLPGASPLSRLGVSPPSRLSGLTQMMDASTELMGRDSTVASWHLRREQEWGEIRRVFQQESLPSSFHSPRINSLAHAELSTFSRAHRILPRPIYLSHQFSFYALGEDYHALIRRSHFDIGRCKIEVRKEVEVSAYSAGSGELFVEGFSAPRDARRYSNPFDEPLASALSAGLDHSHPFRTIIPMLPNGMPGSNPKSFRNSVPIRTMTTGLSDGVSESIGRIRREIHKVRSPQLGPRLDMSGSVPLEFDEEDEDFLNLDGQHILNAVSRSTSRGEGDSGASISTPSTSTIPLDDEVDDLWHGWNTEDKPAIDELEQFDDVVGFLDEEQTPRILAERTKRKCRAF